MENKQKSSNEVHSEPLQQCSVRRSLNKLKVIMLFIVLLPLLIMLDMMGMDVFSDD